VGFSFACWFKKNNLSSLFKSINPGNSLLDDDAFSFISSGKLFK
jgi:hypothetical protein